MQNVMLHYFRELCRYVAVSEEASRNEFSKHNPVEAFWHGVSSVTWLTSTLVRAVTQIWPT